MTASQKVVDKQFEGFTLRATKIINWKHVSDSAWIAIKKFDLSDEKINELNVDYFAQADGEDLILLWNIWHGWPDPPEWGLASKPSGTNEKWHGWGYFAEMPEKWTFEKPSTETRL